MVDGDKGVGGCSDEVGWAKRWRWGRRGGEWSCRGGGCDEQRYPVIRSAVETAALPRRSASLEVSRRTTSATVHLARWFVSPRGRAACEVQWWSFICNFQWFAMLGQRSCFSSTGAGRAAGWIGAASITLRPAPSRWGGGSEVGWAQSCKMANESSRPAESEVFFGGGLSSTQMVMIGWREPPLLPRACAAL